MFFGNPKIFPKFGAYILCKPSKDLTRPHGGTKRFKGFVAYVKHP